MILESFNMKPEDCVERMPMTPRKYIMGLWSATSQFVNVLLLLGHPNESISGRAHREGWKAKKFINAVFFWQVDHCKSAYTNDLKWAQAYIEQHNQT